MAATIMERPETVALTYDKSNHLAEQTLDFFVTLGIFQVEKKQCEAVFEEKYKDRVLYKYGIHRCNKRNRRRLVYG